MISSLLAQPAAGVLDDGERLGQDLLERRGEFRFVVDRREALLPLGGLLAQRLVRQRLQLLLDLVDALDHRAELLHFAVVLGADDLPDEVAQHFFCLRNRLDNLRDARNSVKGFQPEPGASLRPVRYVSANRASGPPTGSAPLP